MEQYIPDIYQPTIYDINYKKLKKHGIKCILFDLDNTLASLKTDKPSWKMKKFFKELKDMGFQIVLFTNGSIKDRIEPFRKGLDVDCQLGARKPKVDNFEKVMKYYKCSIDQVLIIGDQIYTDILGGNRAGITTALVDRIDGSDWYVTFFNRFREVILLRRMSRKDLFRKHNYYE